MSFLIHKIQQILNRFAQTFCWAQTSYFWRVIYWCYKNYNFWCKRIRSNAKIRCSIVGHFNFSQSITIGHLTLNANCRATNNIHCQTTFIIQTKKCREISSFQYILHKWQKLKEQITQKKFRMHSHWRPPPNNLMKLEIRTES